MFYTNVSTVYRVLVTRSLNQLPNNIKLDKNDDIVTAEEEKTHCGRRYQKTLKTTRSFTMSRLKVKRLQSPSPPQTRNLLLALVVSRLDLEGL